MSKPAKNPYLLPPGFHDLLPAQAGISHEGVTSMLKRFAAHGYQLVMPPSLEYEDSLLHAQGEALRDRIFRIMDPMSQKMMGLRADMTLQVARIAHSRLQTHPSPHRLCYAGEVFRVSPEASSHTRQLTQVGIEMIDCQSKFADIEVATVITDALTALGIKDLTIDLNLPALTSHIITQLTPDPEVQEALQEALQCKDSEAIHALGLPHADALIALTLPTTTIAPLRNYLNCFALDQHWQQLLSDLEDFTTTVRQMRPELHLSIDLLENRGFEYHSGISFSLFSKHHLHELGRGGRYLVDGDLNPIPSVGATVFMDELLELISPPVSRVKLLVPASLSCERLRDYHDQGYATLFAMAHANPGIEEAKQLGCTGVLKDGTIVQI